MPFHHRQAERADCAGGQLNPGSEQMRHQGQDLRYEAPISSCAVAVAAIRLQGQPVQPVR